MFCIPLRNVVVAIFCVLSQLNVFSGSDLVPVFNSSDKHSHALIFADNAEMGLLGTFSLIVLALSPLVLAAEKPAVVKVC